VWFVFVGVNNTLNALEGKLPVVVTCCVFLFEFTRIFLPTDRVTVSGVQFLKHKHNYKHKQELPNT
jgi:hypothetical protein